jgi:hypothetical protein
MLRFAPAPASAPAPALTSSVAGPAAVRGSADPVVLSDRGAPEEGSMGRDRYCTCCLAAGAHGCYGATRGGGRVGRWYARRCGAKRTLSPEGWWRWYEYHPRGGTRKRMEAKRNTTSILVLLVWCRAGAVRQACCAIVPVVQGSRSSCRQGSSSMAGSCPDSCPADGRTSRWRMMAGW